VFGSVQSLQRARVAAIAIEPLTLVGLFGASGCVVIVVVVVVSQLGGHRWNADHFGCLGRLLIVACENGATVGQCGGAYDVFADAAIYLLLLLFLFFLQLIEVIQVGEAYVIQEVRQTATEKNKSISICENA